jgi:hypothetical protein
MLVEAKGRISYSVVTVGSISGLVVLLTGMKSSGGTGINLLVVVR